jgi:Type II secretion system (T2SS), protein G
MRGMALDMMLVNDGKPLPRADGSGADWTGQHALGLATIVEDGWGNPILYRCPGLVHKRGYDFVSCGPNGRFDQGTFDDLVVGGDIAFQTSR